MPEPQYGEPWEVYNKDAEMIRTDHLNVFWLQRAGAGTGNPCLELEDAVARIVACVNFCRQFPTEFLQERHLVYLNEMSDAAKWGTLSEIPGFDGLLTVSMLPVAKDLP